MVMSSHRPGDYEPYDFPNTDLDDRSIDPTLSVTPQAASTFQNRLGTASFRENASLVLYFQGGADPLVIHPSLQMALGRVENVPFEIPALDLVPFGARENGVSRFHALLHRSRRTLAIEDMDSTNGTYVNGQRLQSHAPQVLHDGDELCLGKLVIQIQFQ